MLKRVPLLLAMLFTVGSVSTPVFAQDKEESGSESTTTTETSTEGDGGDPECD